MIGPAPGGQHEQQNQGTVNDPYKDSLAVPEYRCMQEGIMQQGQQGDRQEKSREGCEMDLLHAACIKGDVLVCLPEHIFHIELVLELQGWIHGRTFQFRQQELPFMFHGRCLSGCLPVRLIMGQPQDPDA